MSIPEESDLESEERDETTRTKSRRRRVDAKARRELERLQESRRAFLKKGAIGAGLVALGATLGYGGNLAQATGLSGNTRTVITDNEIAARVIGGVRIATEFIPDPVPAGTDLDPYPGSAIQAALNDGLAVYIPFGTWKLTAPISRAVDNATIIGAGKSTKLALNGISPCISAGVQGGWLIANLATDAGGVDIGSSSQTRMTEVWINGVITDNRPVATAGTGGGFYGARASDFVTAGDGSPLNPFNASAIQAAINSLPSRGGVVFIKEGVWQGTTRITLGKTGNPKARVILQGAGGYLAYPLAPVNDKSLHGTHVACGFDVYWPTDFYDMTVSPDPTRYNLDPAIKFILDPTVESFVHHWLTGFTIRDVRIVHGNPGLWITGQNMPLWTDSWQIWHVMLDRVFFLYGTQAMKIDKGDDIRASQIGLDMRHVHAYSVNQGSAKRTMDIQMDNVWGTWSNLILEGVSQAGVDYAFYVKLAGSHAGHIIQNVFFGDGSFANKDAYFETASGRGFRVFNFMHVKDVDINGGGYFQIGRYPPSGGQTPGVINVTNGNNLVLEPVPAETLALGNISASEPSTVHIKDMSPKGFLGATTPSGSPFTYTNNDLRMENVVLVGGAITDVTRGGQSVGPERSHFLRPGDSIVVAYTIAPTIKRFSVSTFG